MSVVHTIVGVATKRHHKIKQTMYMHKLDDGTWGLTCIVQFNCGDNTWWVILNVTYPTASVFHDSVKNQLHVWIHEQDTRIIGLHVVVGDQ